MPSHATASLNSVLADDKIAFRKALDLYFNAQRADWLVFEKRHDLETPEGPARKENAPLAWSLCIEALRMVRDMENAHFALREAALELFETNPAFDPDVSSLTKSGLAIRAIKTGHKDLPIDIQKMLMEAEALTSAFAGSVALMSFRVLCYPKCPRLGLDFPHFDHTDGLDTSGNFISDAGTLFPIALCGLSSL